MALTLDDIEDLFARRGAEQYSGEPVTQLEHALQTALQRRTGRRRRRTGHGRAAARPRPPAERPGRIADPARHRRPAPVLCPALPARRVRRAGAAHDPVACRRQALPVRDARGLPRRACRPIPSAAWRCKAASSRRPTPSASSRSPTRPTPCGCASGTTSPRKPGAAPALVALPRTRASLHGVLTWR